MGPLIEIMSFQLPELDVYARLSERELLHNDLEPRGLFIAETALVVNRALDAGYQPQSLLLDRRLLDGEGRELIARCGDVPVYTASAELLRELVGFPLTRGVLCAMLRQPEPDLERVCTNARRVAVLEDVMNPTNVGAIFRSAAALGMDAVLLTRRCADPLYRRAIRVSMGNVFLLFVPGFFIFAANGMLTVITTVFLANTVDYGELKNKRRDESVIFSMQRGVDSLNVAAASAVAFWELGTRDK